MSESQSLDAIVSHFQINGEFVGANPYGSGHINDTFCIIFDQSGLVIRYILQRINRKIFTNPIALMENIERVTSHIASRITEDAGRRVLSLVPTRESTPSYEDEDGNHWRVYRFIEDARTYDAVESPEQAFQAAKAFGSFQKLLADLPLPRLHDTIPDFHHTPKRYEYLQKTISVDTVNRAAFAKREIDFVLRRGSMVSVLIDASLPERVTHNDTKFNNVMLDDQTGEGICVIDLDTVMPGLALYDFGDMVRTTTSTSREDELDLSKVKMEFAMFQSLVTGYLSSAGEFLSKEEVQYLVFSSKLITLEQAIRFLADHLAGDIYYKVHHDTHNLDRCRTQLKLFESIEQQENAMERLVASIAS
jgi:hypothetical protein